LEKELDAERATAVSVAAAAAAEAAAAAAAAAEKEKGLIAAAAAAAAAAAEKEKELTEDLERRSVQLEKARNETDKARAAREAAEAQAATLAEQAARITTTLESTRQNAARWAQQLRELQAAGGAGALVRGFLPDELPPSPLPTIAPEELARLEAQVRALDCT
jgi:hypothetical protein